MTHQTRSRRFFLQASSMSAVAACAHPWSLAAQPALTAKALADQMLAKMGAPAGYQTVRDRFKAGSPDTPVRGVASTFMDTLDVLQRAHAAGLNFIVTHEPTFWSDEDTVSDLGDDPLYKRKLAFVETNGMVVWRTHDLWHQQKPEPMSTAMTELMGWKAEPGTEGYRRIYVFPSTPMHVIAGQLAQKLQSRSVRMVGDPNLPIRTLTYGSHALAGNITGLEHADAIVMGEVRDWDSVEYVRDLSESGQKKGLIVLSHEASEENGMELFTHWFHARFPGLRCEFIPTHDRLWMNPTA